MQPCAPSPSAAVHQLQAMQMRLRSSLPSRAFFTNSGSAMSAAPRRRRRTRPAAIAASASAIEVMRPSTLSTGTLPGRAAHRLDKGTVRLRLGEDGRHAVVELLRLHADIEIDVVDQSAIADLA